MKVAKSGGVSRRRHAALWLAALLLTVAAAGYQRRTGPTYPVRGQMEVAGATYDYRLARSGSSDSGARVELPQPDAPARAYLHFRRHRTDDEFTTLPLDDEGDRLAARLPGQPPAGKLEYFITLDTSGGRVSLPGPERGTVVIRFKDDVPIYFLLPHVLFMFCALLLGVRAGLGAAFAPAGTRRLAGIALALMTVGGLVLGPIVQKFAFGAFWTGFPFGYDLTDNKVLIMWLVWLATCAFVALSGRERRRRVRAAVVAAAVVMLAVYVIPHSAQGSELDWDAIEAGVPASEAVRTGASHR